MEEQFLVPSPIYHELQILLLIERSGPISLPLDPRVLPALSLEQLPLARLIDDGVLSVQDASCQQVVALTDRGRSHMRRLAIDYHLELMALRETTDAFFRERIATLAAAGFRRILLHGASDTARAFIECLRGSAIKIVGIVDDDPRKHGGVLGGIPILGPGGMGRVEFDLIVVTTVAYEDDILKRYRAVNDATRRVVGLFDR
jgi:hypothetical protein